MTQITRKHRPSSLGRVIVGCASCCLVASVLGCYYYIFLLTEQEGSQPTKACAKAGTHSISSSQPFWMQQHVIKTRTRTLEFVHITKTGGTSVETAGRDFGIPWGLCHYKTFETNDTICRSDWSDQTYFRDQAWHSPPSWFKGLNPYAGHDTFTIVRNPYSRAISEYYCPYFGFRAFENDANQDSVVTLNIFIRDKVNEMMKMLEQGDAYSGYKNPHFLPQHLYILGDEAVQTVNHILHKENLTDEFNELMQLYGLNVTLTKESWKNTGERKHFNHQTDLSCVLEQETLELLNRVYRKDFELLGYETMGR